MTQQREFARDVRAPRTDMGDLLDLALHMATRADDIALVGFGASSGVETKGDGSPVTRVDREVESAIRDTIEREHPEAGVLGEEYGEEDGFGRWVIDPIDGTRQFIDGDPRFAVLIAYEIDGVSQVGVVSAPALELRWWAADGLGARTSYRGVVSAARVSSSRRLDRSSGMLLGGFHTEGWPEGCDPRAIEGDLEAEGVRLSRRGVSWEAVRVSAGEFDFALTTGYRWDVAPLPVIVREAGGEARVTEDETGISRVVVSNRHLAPALARLA